MASIKEEYIWNKKEVEGWLVADRGQKIRALGDLSPKAVRFMRQMRRE